MFNPKSDKKVKQLCRLELKNARKHWGEDYSSIKEADEVLIEEISEADIEISRVKKAFVVWRGRVNDSRPERDPNQAIDLILESAKNGIKELAQVCAVCEKIKKSVL